MVGHLIEIVIADLRHHVVQDVPDGQRLAQQVEKEGVQKVPDVIVELLGEAHDEEVVGVIRKLVAVDHSI